MMKRKSREGRLALVGLMVAVVVTSIGATPPLNPLVIRADQQRGAVPAECDDSLAPAPTPRVDVRQIPLPEPEAAPAPPPSASLRDAVRGVQEALSRNDRAAFDTELARVRTLVRGYPAGAEKRSAEELLTIYNDIERLWNAQYESPFFARNSGEYAIASRYPGWEDAVRRSILTDARGERFYPAGETREFIARAAALRLSRLGVSAPYPAPRTPREETARRSTARESTTRSSTTTTSPPGSGATASPRTTSRNTTASAPRSSATTATTRREKTAARSASTTPRSAARKPAARVAEATPRKTATRTSAPPSTGSSAPSASSASTTSTATSSTARSGGATTSPAAPADPAPVSGPGDVQPLTGGEVATPFETAPDSAGTDTALATDTTFATDTALTTDSGSPDGTDTLATSATTTTDAATPPASRGRSVILPLILILIGLGVLVVLFRMSN